MQVTDHLDKQTTLRGRFAITGRLVLLPCLLALLAAAAWYFLRYNPESSPELAAIDVEVSPQLMSSDDSAVMVISTQNVTESSYSAGGLVAMALRNFGKKHHCRIAVEPKIGSNLTLKSILDGDSEFGLVPASVEYAITAGVDGWVDPDYRKLRFVCAVYDETLTLVVPGKSPIHTVQDLAGKRVGIGLREMAINISARQVLASKDLLEQVKLVEKSTTEILDMMRRGELDAFFLRSVTPNHVDIANMLPGMNPRFVVLSGMEDMLRTHSYMSGSFVRNEVENDKPQVLDAVSEPVVLVTSVSTPSKIVNEVLLEITAKLPSWAADHPQFFSGSSDNFRRGQIFPLHMGTRAFFRSKSNGDHAEEDGDRSVRVMGFRSAPGDPYTAAEVIARIINGHRESNGFGLLVKSTPGLMQSVEGLAACDLDFAIGTSSGASLVSRGKLGMHFASWNLRSICNVDLYTVYLISAKESGIKRLEDLSHKRVGILEGSLREVINEILPTERQKAFSEAKFTEAELERIEKQFLNGELDAIMFSASSPSDVVKRIISKRQSNLIPVELGASEQDENDPFLFLEEHKEKASAKPKVQEFQYFKPIKINVKDDYPELASSKPINSVGIYMTLYTNADVPNDVVKRVTQEILENQKNLTAKFPSIISNPAERMRGLTAPIHPGAKEFFTQEGKQYLNGKDLQSLSAKGVTENDSLPWDARKTFIISAGPVGRPFYAIGGALAFHLSASGEKNDIQFAVTSSGGSIDNINAVGEKSADFGLAQSWRLNEACTGRGPWQGHPVEPIRAVCTVNMATLTVVAAVDRNFELRSSFTGESQEFSTRNLWDLKGKRVSLGLHADKGERGKNIDIFLDTDFKKKWMSSLDAEEPPINDAIELFKSKRIDAFLYTAIHPDPLIELAVQGKRKANFASVVSEELTGQSAYYLPATVPATLYPGVQNRDNVSTIGVPIVLFTHKDTADDVVLYSLARIHQNLNTLRKSHPIFKEISPEMLSEGLTAPAHRAVNTYLSQSNGGRSNSGNAHRLIMGIPVKPDRVEDREIEKQLHLAAVHSNVEIENTLSDVENLNSLLVGGFDFVLTDTSWVFDVVNSMGPWQGLAPATDIRSVCNLEHKTLVMMSTGNAVHKLSDLKTRRVRVALPGLSSQALTEFLLERKDVAISSEDALKLLESKDADAVLFSMPATELPQKLAEAYDKVSTLHPIELTDLTEKARTLPFLTPLKVTLPLVGPDNKLDLTGFSTASEIVTTRAASDDSVRLLLENIVSELKKGGMNEQEIIENLTQGLVAPLHPAAEKYFQQLRANK